MTAGALRVEGLVGGYGPVTIVHGIDLVAAGGATTLLLGSNGAGKSTILQTLAGLLPCRGGSIRLDGEPVEALSADQRVDRGIVLVPEGRMVLPGMTVEENLRIGGFAARVRPRIRQNLERVYALFPRLVERRRQRGGTLSGGEQQMLALGRGLMAEPRVLLLDEPTLGLAPVMSLKLFEIIAALGATGLTILLAEQDVHRSLALASEAYLVENGRIRLSGPAAELAGMPEIREAYLGL